MPTGTYNLLTEVGSIIEDPPIVIEIEGIDGEWGLNQSTAAVETVVGYALMREKDVTLGEKDEYYDEHGHPAVDVRSDGGELRFEWSDDKGDYVEVTE